MTGAQFPERAEKEFIFFAIASRPALHPTQAPAQLVPRAPSTAVKRA